MVLEATRMTNWNNTNLANHTDKVKEGLTGKEYSARFARVYGSFRMRPFVKEPQSASIARSSATMPGHAGQKSTPTDIAQADITPINARTTNNRHAIVQTA